jgi:sulfite reductase (NADPH) hemoprotein beta-component
MTLKIVTANRLREGDVVYLSAAGAWSQWISDSAVARTPEEETRLIRIAEQAVADRLVVGPYATEVARDDGGIQPLGQREIIRAKGPTTHPDFGKQAIQRH